MDGLNGTVFSSVTRIIEFRVSANASTSKTVVFLVWSINDICLNGSFAIGVIGCHRLERFAPFSNLTPFAKGKQVGV